VEPKDAAAPSPRAIAVRAALVTLIVYGGYALTGWLGLSADLRFIGLVAAFYFLPSVMLQADPERQRRYEVGPGGVVPPWRWSAARLAGLTALVVFPPFVMGCLWFYAHVCDGTLAIVREAWPQLDRFFGGLCRAHNGRFWPDAVRVPRSWFDYGGGGLLLAAAVEVFAIALPEEVFHRGYLMSALAEVWPPRRRILGAGLGAAAVVSSALFAIGHLIGMAEVARLATFFPALLFAWLWSKSGSLWAPTLFHAASNLLMAILIASTFPR